MILMLIISYMISCLCYYDAVCSRNELWIQSHHELRALIRGPAHWNPADRVAKRQVATVAVERVGSTDMQAVCT